MIIVFGYPHSVTQSTIKVLCYYTRALQQCANDVHAIATDPMCFCSQHLLYTGLWSKVAENVAQSNL